MDPQVIVTLVTDLGAFGFILWLVQRTFSHTIPRLAAGFERSMKTMQESFDAHSDKQRMDFREIVMLQRADFDRILEREQAIHEAQTNKIIGALEEVAREVRNVSS